MTKKGEIMDSIRAKMGAVRGYLALPQMEASNRTYILLAFAAYIFSIAIHAYWFKVYGGNEIFRFNGEYIITSPDGWFFGRGAKDALAGAVGIADGNMQVAALGKLAAVLKSVLPFLSLETIMFYSPVVIGSLSVIPLVLIGRLYSQPIFGLLSALFVVSLPGFYGRMGFGYFDDDLLTLQMPLWVLYATLLVAKTQNTKNLIFLGLTVLFYQWWYPKSFSIISALAIMLFIYTLLFDRRRFGLYLAVGVMLLGLSDMPLWMRLASVLFISYFYDTFALMSQKARVVLLLSIIALFAMLGGFEPMVGPFKMYFFRSVADSGGDGGLHYYTSLKTVAESMSKPFALLMPEFAGGIPYFWLGIAGFLMMMLLFPATIILSPFIAIGLLSIDSGSRFVPYANMAFGISLAFFSAYFLSFTIKRQRIVGYALTPIAAVAILWPLPNTVKANSAPSGSTSMEVSTLSEFGKNIKKDDVIYSWWDYGYMVKFYSGASTHTDGGMQGGDGSFVDSAALTYPNQLFSANLLRETTEHGSFFGAMKAKGYDDPNRFIAEMSYFHYKPSVKTKEAYLMIPFRMMNILNVIVPFSSIELTTGIVVRRPPVFVFSQSFNEVAEKITLDNKVVIDKNRGMVIADSVELPIKAYYKIQVDATGKQEISGSISGAKDGLSIVYNVPMNYYLIMDDSMVSSTFAQLYIFENYDKELYEMVVTSPMMKIFRIKK